MAVLNDEQKMLKDAAAAWVRERAPVTELRKLKENTDVYGFQPSLYQEMAEMGWAGILIPEAYGGVEFGFTGLGLILEELGKTLTASPLLSCSLAASALVLGGSEEQKQEFLPGIAAGEMIAALAIDEDHRHAPLNTALQAERNANGWQLSGSKTAIAEGMSATLAIVLARTAGNPGDRDGLSLFIVNTAADGLRRSPRHQIDARDIAHYEFEQLQLPADALLGEEGKAADIVEPVLDRACIALAAEMLGNASEALDVTLEYLKIREQFGAIIGSFQALQHRAAHMLGELELTRSAIEAALQAVDDEQENLSQLASLAKVLACDTLKLISNEMIQMHGGIGMTDEHDAGLYIKRARAAAASYGNASYHRLRYARLSGF